MSKAKKYVGMIAGWVTGAFMGVLRFNSLLVQWVTRYGSVWLVFWIGLLYGIKMPANLEEDTTNITNLGFAVLATLAGLSFAAGASADQKQIAEDYRYSAESFYHAALLVLMASLVKYIAVDYVVGDSSVAVVGRRVLGILDFSRSRCSSPP